MGTCTIIGVVVHCLLTGVRPTPAQAAATLQTASPAYVAAPTLPAGGPVAAVVGTRAPVVPLPLTRLDGTPYSQPAWIMRAYVGHRGQKPNKRDRK